MKQIYAFFIDDRYRNDEILFRKVRMFINTSFISAIFGIFYIFISLYCEMPHIVAQIGIYTLIYLTLPFLLRTKLPYFFVSNLFIFLFWTSSIYDTAYMGGLHSGTIPWFALVAVLATLLDNLKSGFFWLCLSFLAVTVIGIMELTGTSFISEANPKLEKILMLTSHQGLVAIVFMVAYVMERAYLRTLNQLDQNNKIIEQEKKRSDELLLNILPFEVMEELKSTGKTNPQSFDKVTVLFADVKGFTTISEDLSPEELISTLDEYFGEFDKIIQHYNVEKIKTIGDAYVCAGGLPIADTQNPENVVNAAIEFVKIIEELEQKRSAENKVVFTFRIGIHTGSLVAGIVGIKKFVYDIWGDTVNTAARMEQNSEPGKIKMSETTYNLVKEKFSCEYRGEIEAKNKGKLKMYFVNI